MNPAYACPKSTVNPVVGFGDPDYPVSNGRRAFTFAAFLLISMASPRYGRAVWETFGSAGTGYRFANLHGSSSLFGDGEGEKSALSGVKTMTNPACNPSVVSVFNFKSNEVRTVIRDGEPWFVASDVAAALGYRNAPDAIRCLSDCQKADTQIVRTSSNGSEQTRSVTLISESGLYRLVLRSRKPEAAAFSDWVTGEVLPTIRKTGRYGQQAEPPAPAPVFTRESISRFIREQAEFFPTEMLVEVAERVSGVLYRRSLFMTKKINGGGV